MHRRTYGVGLFLITLALLGAPVVDAQETGSIEGRVVGPEGVGLRNVTIVLNETGEVAISDQNGDFGFTDLTPGEYSISYTLGENAETESGVSVAAGETTELESAVDWDVSFVETITVVSFRGSDRIVDAPAAISVVGAEEIANEASHGQVPKLVEFTPGAEVTQSGLYDYNLNTRGFNSSLNRRVVTLVDGRDPSVPFLASQNWASLSFPLDDVAAMEMVRGPSAALYGANASSGVVNVITKRPDASRGGLLRLTGGEVSTAQADFRWAGEIGSDWYFKLLGSYRDTGDFSVSRVGAAEYSVPCGGAVTSDCLPQEARPVDPLDEVEVSYYSGRLDKAVGEDKLYTFEYGTNETNGVVAQTGIGRVQFIDVGAEFARFNASGERWNFLAYYNDRDAAEQRSLTSGLNLVLDTDNLAFEFQTNWDLGDDARLVAGVSYSEDEIDSFDPATGSQSVVFDTLEGDFSAVFAQVDWNLSERVKLVLAGRYDDSSLHDAQFSPKGALVWRVGQDNALRLTYNEAFQVPNYSEYFLAVPVALPTDLSGLNFLVCAPFGVDCGLGVTPILGVGNESLELEEIETFEIGYSAVMGNSLLTIDYYNSKSNNFITDLLPQLGTALGRVNPNFGPWAAPPGTPDAIADTIRALVPTLSNAPDGSNAIIAVSYANFGEVDSQGVDLGLTSNFARDWTLHLAGSWFDFDIKEDLPGFDQLLLPNSPEYKLSAGLDYSTQRWNASISGRWVDDFRWAVGPFQGDVESYTTVDLNANWNVTDNIVLGLNVANLFDDVHYEAFGGDLLERRALGSVTFNW